jgi:hypothetical protein
VTATVDRIPPMPKRCRRMTTLLAGLFEPRRCDSRARVYVELSKGAIVARMWSCTACASVERNAQSGVTVTRIPIERPLLFQAPMVVASIADRKHQTRRMRGLEDINRDPDRWTVSRSTPGMVWFHLVDNVAVPSTQILCPYGAPGDRLWVRETAALIDNSDLGVPHDDPEHRYWEYRADGDYDRLPGDWPPEERANPERPRWTPAIHMPRAASRLLLDVTAVRVERLQDISEADAIDEGVKADADGCFYPPGQDWSGERAPNPQSTARSAYAVLWDSINGAGSWDANPWVWVVGFKRMAA